MRSSPSLISFNAVLVEMFSLSQGANTPKCTANLRALLLPPGTIPLKMIPSSADGFVTWNAPPKQSDMFGNNMLQSSAGRAKPKSECPDDAQTHHGCHQPSCSRRTQSMLSFVHPAAMRPVTSSNHCRFPDRILLQQSSGFPCSAIIRSDALGEDLKSAALVIPILRERILAAQDVADVHPSSTIARHSVPPPLADLMA